jgi:hypothetical protein
MAFINAFNLKIGDIIQTIDGSDIIQSIEIQKAQPVIGIKLFNNGCYFANNILSHSQDVLPNFVVHILKQTKDPKQQQIVFRAQATKTFTLTSNTVVTGDGSCVAFGTQILLPNKTLKLVEEININDWVLGFDEAHNSIENKVVNKKVSFSTIYKINFEDSFLECSNTHLIFSFTDYDYRFVWQLNVGDYILFSDCVKEIIDIQKLEQGSVVALNFEKPGNFFANGVLGHSENIPIQTNKFNNFIKAMNTNAKTL